MAWRKTGGGSLEGGDHNAAADTPEDEVVLDAVAAHLGELRRADLAAVCHPEPLAGGLDADARRRVRRERRRNRKGRLTAQSSARWANAIIRANDDQYRLARDAQYRHIVALRAAIATIERRLVAPTSDTLTPEERMARRPVGQPARIDLDLSGSAARRDAQVRHAITRLIHYARRYGITTIAVEDLDFVDARTAGRETMGRGQRGKRFRKTVAGIPTAVFRNRLTAQTAAAGIQLLAVNPAYTSAWGEQHWRKPYTNVTRHQAAATVIGRRAQGHKARRREGVTPTRPEDRVVRATVCHEHGEGFYVGRAS